MDLWLSPPLMHVRARRASGRSAPDCDAPSLRRSCDRCRTFCNLPAILFWLSRVIDQFRPLPLPGVKRFPRPVASTLFSLRSPWNSARICRFVSETGMGEVGALEFKLESIGPDRCTVGCSQVAGNQTDRGIDRRNIVAISVARRWQALVQ